MFTIKNVLHSYIKKKRHDNVLIDPIKDEGEVAEENNIR